MPRAQTPPLASRAHSRVSPINSKPLFKRRDLSPEVVELSSDADTPLQPPHKHHKRATALASKNKPKSELKSQENLADVIEISSGEEDEPTSQETLLALLRSQVKKLQQEKVQVLDNYNKQAQELSLCQKELKEINDKASRSKATAGKLVLDPSELEDGLNCEICAFPMYTPFLLPDCGHTFCLSCLRDWFGTAHARFLQLNPLWNRDTTKDYITRIQTLLRPEYLAHPQIYLQLQHLQRPIPEYTCPTCRERVHRRPVEVYSLKSLIRTISVANEAERGRVPSEQPFVERRHGNLVVVDPWDGFFPRER